MAYSAWQYDEARKKYYYVCFARNCSVYDDDSKIPLGAPAQVIYESVTQQQPSSSTPSAPTHSHPNFYLSTISMFSRLDVKGNETTEDHSQSYQAPGGLPGSFPSDLDSPSSQPKHQTQQVYRELEWSHQSRDAGAGSIPAYGQTFLGSGANSPYQTQYSPEKPDVSGVTGPSNAKRLRDVKREILRGNMPQDLRELGVTEQDHRLIRRTGGNAERLDSNFRVLYPGSNYFKRGFVFRILWPELCGDRKEYVTIATQPRFPDEKTFVKLRWFVVVREGQFRHIMDAAYP